jgi:hypothetical protein
MAKRLADLLNGVPDTPAPGKPKRRRMRAMGPMDDDDDDGGIFGFELPDLDDMPPAQLIRLLSESLGPGSADEFRAGTKGLSPKQIKQQMQQMLEAIEQLHASGPSFPFPQPPRKSKK